MRSNPLYEPASQLQRLNGSPGVNETVEPGRTPFQKDYARLLHAPAFRRLQGKTQLFPGNESDFFRNRLTHSLEVAQIASGIARRLNAVELSNKLPGAEINIDLVQFAAIAHDLGHPPFGHNGEEALDELMREHGGFEGNAQTLRLLAVVEKKLVKELDGSHSKGFGLNLTYRTLASVLKYDRRIGQVRDAKAELDKGYYATEARIVADIKERVAPNLGESNTSKTFKTIECSIMDVADDIAYSTYDLEDSLHAGFVTPNTLLNALFYNTEVRHRVYERTNRALERVRHLPLEDENELIRTFGELFPFEALDGLSGIQHSDRNAASAIVMHQAAWRADNLFGRDSEARTQFTAERIGRLIGEVELQYDNEYPQLSAVRLKAPAMRTVELLKHLNYEVVIRSPRLAVAEHRGKEIVKRIFQALADSDGRLLPDEWKRTYLAEREKGLTAALRVVCDYVAGMTDRYAAEFHARLYGEGESIFKPL